MLLKFLIHFLYSNTIRKIELSERAKNDKSIVKKIFTEYFKEQLKIMAWA